MNLIEKIRRSSLAVMIRFHLPTKSSKAVGSYLKKCAKEKGLSTKTIADKMNNFDMSRWGFGVWTEKHVKRVYRGTLVLMPYDTFKFLAELLGTTVSKALARRDMRND